MKINPNEIFKEYENGVSFKESIGSRGLYEQTKINERFFIGDQWHGAKCGNDRPLVRHNIIKRIGDFKMAQVLSSPISVNFSADGVPNTVGIKGKKRLYDRVMESNYIKDFSDKADNDEIGLVMSLLSAYQKVTAERVGLNTICSTLLKNAYVSGTGILYTYWDQEINTGLYADDTQNTAIKGDIRCEVLDATNVYFGDPVLTSVEEQPYIIIASRQSILSVLGEAECFGADKISLNRIKSSAIDGKVLVLTKLFKTKNDNGETTIKCVKATENATVRPMFDTELHLYPLSIFNWETRSDRIYGESEITYLIPNQIAINRMITAQVWASMISGMPMMVVNGDTVSGELTNDPGQIIKIYGSNEDVSGAIGYVTPPDFSSNFTQSISDLINNTLTQSGANEVALGDSKPDNATALITMQRAATLPLQLIKNRFYAFVEDFSRVWVDFWITKYGNRRIKIEDENGIWYMPFNAERYKNLMITAKVEVGADNVYSAAESVNTLTSLYEKGIINKRQYLKRLPVGVIPDISGLMLELEEEEAPENDSK
ncbi:MAG: hypothetical protein E7561_01910 [Ruminococcaceae bacterium]|nr:hypothetical protein [Oscillospiraceae bacterium]